MKNIVILFLLLTISLSAGEDIDLKIEAARALFEVPGVAVGVVVNGEAVLARGYGTCSLNGEKAVSNETLFAIGSCTKAFTTFVLGQLVEEGLVDWDEKVVHYLPEFKVMDQHAANQITVRDLAAHRTGMPRHDLLWYNSSLPRSEFLSRLPFLEPACGLREKFYYNNLMYVVAGLIIEQVTGQSWEETVHSRIFIPLGMEQSNFSVEDSQKASDFALPHANLEGKTAQIPFRNINNVGPAGSINSSIADLLRWIKLQLAENPGLIKKETREAMHTLQIAHASYPSENDCNLGYGLGWMLGIYKGNYLVHHMGSIDGFFSKIILVPEKNIGIVILTNKAETGRCLAGCITNILFDHFLGFENGDCAFQILEQYKKEKNSLDQQTIKKEKERIPNTRPSHPLEDYVGEYFHPGYGTITVQLRDEQLFATYNQIDSPLDHFHYDCFIGSKEAKDSTFACMEFSFSTDGSGRIQELRIPLEPCVDSIVFVRKSVKTVIF